MGLTRAPALVPSGWRAKVASCYFRQTHDLRLGKATLYQLSYTRGR